MGDNVALPMSAQTIAAILVPDLNFCRYSCLSCHNGKLKPLQEKLITTAATVTREPDIAAIAALLEIFTGSQNGSFFSY